MHSWTPTTTVVAGPEAPTRVSAAGSAAADAGTGAAAAPGRRSRRLREEHASSPGRGGRWWSRGRVWQPWPAGTATDGPGPASDVSDRPRERGEWRSLARERAGKTAAGRWARVSGASGQDSRHAGRMAVPAVVAGPVAADGAGCRPDVGDVLDVLDEAVASRRFGRTCVPDRGASRCPGRLCRSSPGAFRGLGGVAGQGLSLIHI